MTIAETHGQAESERHIERLTEYTVVDADIHEIIPDPGKYVDYVADRYKPRVRKVARSDEPLGCSLIGTFDFDLDPTPHGLGREVKTTTPEGIRAFMDRFNTDYVILHGHELEGVSDIPEVDYATELIRAYNDFMLAEYLDNDDGFKSSIRVPTQDPHAGAEEIDRLADEDDLVSVHIQIGDVDLLGDRRFDPIYEAAADHGLNIDYHPGYPNPPWANSYGGHGLQSTVEEYSLLSQMQFTHLPSMIFGGVAERFPDLKHVFLEQGIAWIPWLRGRMDKNYERRRHDLPMLSRPPSDYLAENFYFGTQPIEDATVAGLENLMAIFEMIDAENSLMYTSDFPHFDFDYPSMTTIPNLSESAERKIFGGNALEVFDF